MYRVVGGGETAVHRQHQLDQAGRTTQPRQCHHHIQSLLNNKQHTRLSVCVCPLVSCQNGETLVKIRSQPDARLS